jgi:hypothetical protein
VNPAPFGITFSAANLVTANVPGGGAVYAGNAAVSQGAILGQPAVGGTGNVTWNPGVLAAGATALLTYRVDVTPTAPGQRIPATGTPALNGTSARFVDETGNTTQARATFTFGPLCELAVTQGLLTHVVVSSFRTVAEKGKLVVEWETSSEVGTAGFYLYRFDAHRGRYVQVNQELVPALFGEPQGGTYRLVDDGAALSKPNTYALVEVEQGGGRRVYGAYRVEATTASSAHTEFLVGGESRTPRRLQASAERGALRQLRRDGRAAVDSLRWNERRDTRARRAPRADAVKIAVRERGIYSLSAEELAPLLGVPSVRVSQLIASRRLSLTHRGQPVAWHPTPGHRGLLFFGEEIDSIFTTDNIYWLAIGRGLTMEEAAGGALGSPPGALTFTDTVHYEENRFAATAAAPDPDADYWFWEGFSAGHPTFGKKSFTLPAQDCRGDHGERRAHRPPPGSDGNRPGQRAPGHGEAQRRRHRRGQLGRQRADYRGLGRNLFPPLMVRTPSGLFASDSAFGDVLGNDGVPEMAIGRISVATAEEFSAYLRKVQTFEASGDADWARRVEMLADNPDRDANFPADSERVAELVPPPYVVGRIYLSEMAPADAREALFTALAEGVGFINYLGHGGAERLAEEGLLRIADVVELKNSERLPVLTAMTCSVGRFELPGYSTLAEELQRKADGGTVAVWAPSGLSDNAEARILATGFFRAVFQHRLNNLGEVVLRALNDYAAQGGRKEMLQIYQLFGDPALRLKDSAFDLPGAPHGAARDRTVPE